MAKRNLILFDDSAWLGLLPLTWLRPVAELRIGILTMRERWETLLNGLASQVTQDFLAAEFPLEIGYDNYFINGSLLPSVDLIEQILDLRKGQAITFGDELLAARLDKRTIENLSDETDAHDIEGFAYEGQPHLLRRPYDLFRLNEQAILRDFELVCGQRVSEPLSSSNTVLGEHPIFLELGARCEASILNVTAGPIYIGRNAEVMEGAMLRGPLAICEGSVIKMGAKIYSNTTVGPFCKVGGEVQNVVFQANSNKGHDGYLGNSVIGEWCNLGADTNSSNLKNNYAEVKLWSYETERFELSELQFCGLIMGDHAKCGINTMFNTGTVVGVGANVFGDGFPRNFVPDFAWGGAAGMSTFKLDKMLETAERVYARRNQQLSASARESLRACFALTQKHRRWEQAGGAAVSDQAKS